MRAAPKLHTVRVEQAPTTLGKGLLLAVRYCVGLVAERFRGRRAGHRLHQRCGRGAAEDRASVGAQSVVWTNLRFLLGSDDQPPAPPRVCWAVLDSCGSVDFETGLQAVTGQTPVRARVPREIRRFRSISYQYSVHTRCPWHLYLVSMVQ